MRDFETFPFFKFSNFIVSWIIYLFTIYGHVIVLYGIVEDIEVRELTHGKV